MKFSIKSKLSLGMIFIYINVLALALLSNFYVFRLSSDSEKILHENYNTLQYCNNMLMALDEAKSDHLALAKFETNLIKQENNITEPHEKEITAQIRIPFEKLKINPADSTLYEKIRQPLYQVTSLNQTAMEMKNHKAIKTAGTAKIFIGILGGILLILMLTFVINFPGYIANPIRILTNGIKEIAAKNYNQRIQLKSTDEFGELAHAFNLMAQKLEEYDNSKLAKILVEKKRIETLINNMHDPVIGLDENKIILFANDEAFKVTGVKQEEFIGKNANDIALTNDLVRYLMQGFTSSDAASNKGVEKPLKIFADNKESYFDKEVIDITITPTGEEKARHIGHVIVLRNITPFKELDVAKTNFIATVSHELKTPISSILMSLDLLENEKIGTANSEQKQLIKSIKEDSERLLKITGELLNMTQVETGKIQLSLQPSPPQEIIHYATESVKVQAEQKNSSIEINCPENIPAVNADREKTAWVLTNLLSNAIRYSYENSKVLLTVKEVQNKIQFSVQDFGKGIDPKYQLKIFDRYFQIPGSSKSGTGLGLAISKEFIEAQGGEISLQSEIGKGSTFSISLNKAVASI